MPTFRVELERLCAQRARQLGRDLTAEELREIDGHLFQSWIEAGRLDELIRTVIANAGRNGGLVDITVLGHHLRETQDAARIHTLFRRLISIRVKAFHQWWPRAPEGHVGSMREAARAAAEAMDAYSEYFISLDRLGLMEEREDLRAEMKRFQAREPAKSVLPRAEAMRGGAAGHGPR